MTTPPLSPESPAAVPVSVAKPRAARWLRYGLLVLWSLAVLAVLGVVWLSNRVTSMQEQLARQSALATADATEARVMAKQAQSLALETSAKIAITEGRLSEVALQRAQLEELMQSLSRSRDENLVVDIEAGLRLAQQQAQLTGSVEPLLAALKTAEVRLSRAAQPRLAFLQRAIDRDMARIKATAVADTPALLLKLDELVLLADDLVLANAVQNQAPPPVFKRSDDESVLNWSARMWQTVTDELRTLVRVSRIDHPQAVLVSPEQAFFLRENLKLRLLNARLGLMSRQTETVRSDLAMVEQALQRYFDRGQRKTQVAQGLLQQVRSQVNALEVPRIDETMAALATAAAGR